MKARSVLSKDGTNIGFLQGFIMLKRRSMT